MSAGCELYLQMKLKAEHQLHDSTCRNSNDLDSVMLLPEIPNFLSEYYPYNTVISCMCHASTSRHQRLTDE
jgi:hypothetical protein